jgi:hypothetical protein
MTVQRSLYDKPKANRRQSPAYTATQRADLAARPQAQGVNASRQTGPAAEGLTRGAMLQLQRTIGNQAVGQLLAQRRQQSPIAVADDNQIRRAPVYAFGNAATPRAPRTGIDIIPDANGDVGPTDPRTGASTFADVSFAPLTGHYHGTEKDAFAQNANLDIIADGSDVGGTHRPTHHTIFPRQTMSFNTFSTSFSALPWAYGGRKR